jgi:hypothetical protein
LDEVGWLTFPSGYATLESLIVEKLRKKLSNVTIGDLETFGRGGSGKNKGYAALAAQHFSRFKALHILFF